MNIRHDRDCLSAETLAAFVDGCGHAADRRAIEAHLACCPACYEALVEVTALLAEQDVDAGEPVLRAGPARLWSRRRLAGVGVAAAAAALWLTISPPSLVQRWRADRPDLVELTHAVGTRRTTTARLTGGFEFGPAPSPLRGAIDEAPSRVLAAASSLREAMESDRTPSRLAAYASARLVLGDATTAIEALREALAATPTASWSTDLAAAYLTRAETPGFESDLPQAMSAAEAAVGLDASRPEAWFNLALARQRLGLLPQAVDAWERYLALDAVGPWADEARRRLDDARQPPPPAIPDAQPLREQLFDRALPAWSAALAAGADDTAALAWTAAETLADRLDAWTPDQFAREIVDHADRISRTNGRAAGSLHRGLAAYATGRALYAADEFEKAGPPMTVAAAALAEAGSPLAESATLHLGILAYRASDIGLASRILRQVVNTADAKSYLSLGGRGRSVLGLLAGVAGRRQEAIDEYLMATDLYALAGETGNRAFVRSLTATQLDNLGNPHRAWQARIDALAGTGREGPLLSSAVAAMRQGWHHAAAGFAAAAADAARLADRPTTVVDALRWQAVMAMNLQRPTEAAAFLADARRLIADASGSDDTAWARVRAETDLADAQVDAGSDIGSRLDAADRAMRYFRDAGLIGRLPEIHLISSRLHLAANAPDEAARHLEAGLNQLADQRRYIAVGADQATFTDVVRRLVDDYVTLMWSEGQPDAAFSETERARARDLSRASLMATRLDDLVSTLPEGVVLLNYVVGDEQSFVWMIRRGDHRFHPIAAGRDELGRLIAAMTPPASGGSAPAHVRELLLAPVADDIANSEVLVIVPDGPLHALPFAALPGVRSRYLAEEHQVLLAPSVGLWAGASAALAGQAVTPARVVALGNPRIDRRVYDLPDLPGAELEARAVAAMYDNGRAVTGAQATRDVLVDALLTAHVLHFGGHSVFNSQSPDESRLVVPDGARGGLSSREVRDLSLGHMQLVVLAACQTTAGPMTRSEGPLGLARSFLAAGVPAVVATHWVTSDRASQAFFAVFHEQFAADGDAPRALQAAQLALLRSPDPTLSDPAAWAGFVVMGGQSR